MKSSPFFVMGVVLLASASLLAQQSEAGDAAKTTYAPAPTGFGDEAASRSWEMTDVKADLDGKLDTKSAKVGDRVVLKTTDKVQASDGTVIPRGSRIVGHISEVQAHNNDRAIAQIAIVFDHAELKNGQSVPLHSLIRTVRPGGSVTGASMMDDDDQMSASAMGGGRMGGGGFGGRAGGGLGAGASATTEAGSLGAGPVGGVGGGAVDRTTGTVAGTGTVPGASPSLDTGAGIGANENGEVQLAGHGDAPIQGGAHAAAAERAVPHPTGIPGVMLAGTSTASGLLINADRKDLEFSSGTRFELGVVADR
jgi:hypothetical protein